MKAILGVDGGSRAAWFTFKCPDCNWEFKKDYKRSELLHPEHDGLIFRGNPSLCPNAGKRFKIPAIEVDIEPVEQATEGGA